MNIYKVVFTQESSSLTKPYDSDDSYFIKNGLICFSMDIYLDTYEEIIESKSEVVINKIFSDIKSIEKIGEKSCTFEALADDTYNKSTKSTRINHLFLKQYDHPCCDDVQEQYKKDGYIKLQYSEF